MSVVYTGGTFDLFHEGHIELLVACKRIAGRGGLVVVALNTDDFIERFKHRKPIQDYRERKLMLESCKYVDYVVPNIGGEDSKVTIDGWNNDPLTIGLIDIVAVGSDWANRDYYGQMKFTKRWLDNNNIVLVYVDRRTEQSTTRLKQTVKDW